MSAFAIREIEERFGEVVIRDRSSSHGGEHSDSDETEKPTHSRAHGRDDDGIPHAETQYQAQFMSAAQARKITERIQNNFDAILESVMRKIMKATSRGKDSVIVFCSHFYSEISEFFGNHHLGYIVSPHAGPDTRGDDDIPDEFDVCYAMISW